MKKLYFIFYPFCENLCTLPEMEKRADGADASVLFFTLGCAIFCLYTCKAKKHSVLLPLCYNCPFSTVLLALYF